MMTGALRVSAGGGGGSLLSPRGKLTGAFGMERSELVATSGTTETVGCDRVGVELALAGFAFELAGAAVTGALSDSSRGAASSWTGADVDEAGAAAFAEGEGDSARTSMRSSERGIVNGSPVAACGGSGSELARASV